MRTAISAARRVRATAAAAIQGRNRTRRHGAARATAPLAMRSTGSVVSAMRPELSTLADPLPDADRPAQRLGRRRVADHVAADLVAQRSRDRGRELLHVLEAGERAGQGHGDVPGQAELPLED